MSVSGTVTVANAQSIVSDSEKQKQWKSMENGPWDFAPDWYYFFLHKKYSGAEMYWKWDWFNSGFRVRFKEPKSDVKTYHAGACDCRRDAEAENQKSGE